MNTFYFDSKFVGFRPEKMSFDAANITGIDIIFKQLEIIFRYPVFLNIALDFSKAVPYPKKSRLAENFL
jgi:hypothetical protein